MPDHNWVFYRWEIARERGWIRPLATLVHLDAHLDDLYDGVEVAGFYDIQGLEDAYFAAERMDIANFIWPGFARGTIDQIFFVARYPEDADPFEARRLAMRHIARHIPPGREFSGIHVPYLEDFKRMYSSGKLDRYLTRSVILDLDLDYFNASNNVFEPMLFSDEEILKSLQYLRDIRQWDFVTVALSPMYCGGDEQCEHIYQLFSGVFQLDVNTAEEWPIPE
ncbi:UPF0489 family protein [Alicyclobacillus tolerans]|nr:UPF0489 family protein [Alicyclobacillus hesperidum]